MMITFLIINLLCIVAIGIYFLITLSLHARNVFNDITKLYKLVIIIFPFIIFFVNLIYSLIKDKNLILLSLYPLIIPSVYFLYNFYDNHSSKRKFLKLSTLKEEITTRSKEHDLKVNPEDVRIRILPRNRVDIIVNIYNPSKRDLLKEILSDTEDFLYTTKKFNNTVFNFYIDIKKKTKVITHLTQKIIFPTGYMTYKKLKTIKEN